MQTNNDNNENNNKMASILPMMALKDIPEPKPDASEIVALIKDGGKVVGYKLSDGRTLNKQEGVALAKQGGIRGVGVSTNQGTEYLKSLPDDKESNNLGSLPSISGKATLGSGSEGYK